MVLVMVVVVHHCCRKGAMNDNIYPFSFQGFLAGPSDDDPPPLSHVISPHFQHRQIRAAKPLGVGE